MDTMETIMEKKRIANLLKLFLPEMLLKGEAVVTEGDQHHLHLLQPPRQKESVSPTSLQLMRTEQLAKDVSTRLRWLSILSMMMLSSATTPTTRDVTQPM